MGKSKVRLPLLGLTLLAMAKELWNTSLLSSREKTPGSPAEVVHEIVAGPPEDRFFGVLMVRAETKGTTSVKAASTENILKDLDVGGMGD